MKGRKLHDHHKSKVEVDKLDYAVPRVSIDDVFMGNSETSAIRNPNLATYGNATDSIQVYVTKKKGAVVWLPRAIRNELEALRYCGCRMMLNSDEDNAIMEVKRSMAEERLSPTSMIESPIRESQSYGKMQKAIQKWQGQTHTLKLALGDNRGV